MCSNFWPEPTGIGVYTTDLADSLDEANVEVSVLTSLPHYPWWKTPAEYSYITEGSSHRKSIEVIRVRHLIPPKMNAMLRVRFEISLWWNLRRVSRKLLCRHFDLVISCIPTVAAGVVGQSIATKLGIPLGLIVQDLSGFGAKQSGLPGGALISKIAVALESAVLKAANSIVVVSPAMRDVVLDSGVPTSKVLQIINYAARKIVTIDRNLARKSLGWAEDEFIAIHAGNIGAKQDLEIVVEASKALGPNSKIKIYLVGHGNQEANLKRMCEGLLNIAVIAAVADDQYSALLSAADLLLVNERSTQMEMSLPSKLTSYLYSQRPVLAAVPRGGATWKFLDGIAELVEAGRPLLLARAIEDLSQDPGKRKRLASRGLEFARKNLDVGIGRKKYLDWVQSLIQSKRG